MNEGVFAMRRVTQLDEFKDLDAHPYTSNNWIVDQVSFEKNNINSNFYFLEPRPCLVGDHICNRVFVGDDCNYWCLFTSMARNSRRVCSASFVGCCVRWSV